MNKYLKQTTKFLTEVKTEIKKVSWPSRKETTGGTVVVLIAVLIAASFLGIVDISLSKIVKVLIQY
ncbi:MAG TPA: preprotein translocase subunit SecE [Nitrospinota bacterium]|jgi:preprotein translocase subunit SecE|nr:preprotein translocase subunit SecE [Nitrospinota bacterium]|tara:strand:+ start:172 stop:369 length:198 start_codon:yes stop_codon:yes gene_type:complete